MRIITNNIKNKNGRKSHTFHIRRRTTDERKWRCCVRGLFARFVYLSRARAHYFSAHRLFIPVEWHSFHGPFMLCSIVVLHLLLIFYHSSAVQFFFEYSRCVFFVLSTKFYLFILVVTLLLEFSPSVVRCYRWCCRSARWTVYNLFHPSVSFLQLKFFFFFSAFTSAHSLMA